MAQAMIDARPLPQPDEDSAPYWQGCRDGELRMQRCKPCGHLRFPPRPMCPRCQSLASGWVPVSGRGTLYSWVRCHPPLLPAFQQRAPLVVVLVELEEGEDLRLVGNWLGPAEEEIEIGLPVEVVFERVSEEISLPQWQRRAPRD